MNEKGFTLIELIGVIVIIAILVSIVSPMVIRSLNLGKDNSYKIMLDNIVTASKSYYEECKYGVIKDDDGNKLVCNNNSEISISLGDLVDLGFLPGTMIEECDELNNCTTKKVIKNPKTEDIINDCQIIIKHEINEKKKVLYTITGTTDKDYCPQGLIGSSS